MFDFSFENPLDGKFKDLPAVKQLVENYPFLVKQASTSYCHYGYDYRKRTVFVTSLTGFSPTAPCQGRPCAWLRAGLEHPQGVLNCTADQKNSIPPSLIDLLIQSWKQRHAKQAKAYLLIDVFSGWGSVDKRVKEAWPDVVVYSNDLVRRSHTNVELDMSADSAFSPSTLLILALKKHELSAPENFKGDAVEWCNAEKIAVLFHCSTPCDTYSVVGLKSHRVDDTLEPKTAMARNHDAMNASLINYFTSIVLTPPPPSVNQNPG